MERKKFKINHQEFHFEISEEEELLKFLLRILTKKSMFNIKRLLANKQVLVDKKITTQFNYLLKPSQTVDITNEKIPEEKQYRGLTIVFEDQHLIIIEKHAGLLSIATDNKKDKTAYSMLSEHVKMQNPKNKIFVVHRLDRETSGLMMFAKNETIKMQLQENWQKTISERSYLAVIEGKMKEPEGTIMSYLRESSVFKVHSSQNPNNGEKAITHYSTIKSTNYYSLLKVNLETGKKNQIRVHLQDTGHPIIGDMKYGSNVNPIGRLGLHAWVLSFVHPVTKENSYFETKIPSKFARLF